MIDERYGRSADMRLHDLRRDELGMPPREPVRSSYIDPDFAPTSAWRKTERCRKRTSLGRSTRCTATRRTHSRRAHYHRPNVVNDGSAAAHDVHASLSLPAHTSYREGTFAIDGTPATTHGRATVRERHRPRRDLAGRPTHRRSQAARRSRPWRHLSLAALERRRRSGAGIARDATQSWPRLRRERCSRTSVLRSGRRTRRRAALLGAAKFRP